MSINPETAVGSPAALFTERQGEVHITADMLALLPDFGVAFWAELRAYIVAHPLLSVATTLYTSHKGDAVALHWVWRAYGSKPPASTPARSPAKAPR